MNKRVKKDILVTSALFILLLALGFVGDGDMKDEIATGEFYNER